MAPKSTNYPKKHCRKILVQSKFRSNDSFSVLVNQLDGRHLRVQSQQWKHQNNV